MTRWHTLLFVLSAGIGVLMVSVSPISEVLQPDRPPVVLVVTESTRADHLPCYGYPRNTTPHLCNLADDGVLFEEAFSQATFTRFAMPSLLTGLPPSAAGMRYWADTVSSSISISGVLGRNGYNTTYWAGTGSRKLVFYLFDDKFLDIRRAAPDEGTFSMVFTESSHGPYTPDDRYRLWDRGMVRNHTPPAGLVWDQGYKPYVNRSQHIALYDGELREVDTLVGRMITAMKREGRYRDSLIIYTADHGEAFGEHGVMAGHGGSPYEEVIHVPLIVKLPGNRHAGTRVDAPVRHIDVLPTVLEVIGIGEPDGTGTPLQPLWNGGSREDVPVYAAGYNDLWGIRQDGFKYIGNVSRCGEDDGHDGELYNLEEDPHEQEDVLESRFSVAAELRSTLCSIYSRGKAFREPSGKRELTEEMRERLERLGYLE